MATATAPAAVAPSSPDQQRLALRWHRHGGALAKALPALLDGGLLCDVTLSAGAHSVRAHRLVLATCSAYFLQLFQEMNATQHPVVVLHNVSIEDIRAVLAFMYKGQCVVSREQLPSLLSVAKLLKVQGLCDMKVPENDSTPTELTEADSPSPKLEATCDTEVNEYLESTNLKRHSTDDTLQATDLSSRSKRLRLSTSPLICCKDNLPITPESNPYTPEEQLYPPFKKTQPPKDSSETCKCFLCGKYLSNQYNLRVHMETHEEAYHACQSCPHVSRSRDALRKHVSYRHPEEYHTRKRKKADNT